MPDEIANPETGAMTSEDAVSFLLTEQAEAPQEGQPQADEPETEEAAAPEAPEAGGEPESAEEVEAGQEDATEAEPDDPEPKYTVKVGGEEFEVSESELVAGYQKDADYRRKSAALAEERKAFQAEFAEAQAQLEEQRLQILAESGEAEPDWVKIFDEDPIDGPRRKVEWEIKQAERQKAAQQLQERQQQQYAETAKAEYAKLIDKVPEWSDPKKFREANESLVEAATSYGYTGDEMASVLDHRFYLTLRDAAAYRKLRAQKPVVEKKVSAAPRVQKPGAAARRDDDAARKKALTDNLKANPNSKDAAVAYLLGG